MGAENQQLGETMRLMGVIFKQNCGGFPL